MQGRSQALVGLPIVHEEAAREKAQEGRHPPRALGALLPRPPGFLETSCQPLTWRGLPPPSDKLRVSEWPWQGSGLKGGGCTFRSGHYLSCPSPEIKKELGRGQDQPVSEGQGLKGPERPGGASHVPLPGTLAPQDLLCC